MPNRKPNRLAEYDYSNPGAYFVTLCVQNREGIFGEILSGEMKLNEYGNIAKKTWTDLPAHFATCQLDEFVIMPNHLHGIIRFADAGVGNRHACSLQCKRQHQQLAVVIGSYKSAVSKYICQNGIKKFKWQKSYYDRIIRSNGEINRIREYIRNNPQNWNADQENPVN